MADTSCHANVQRFWRLLAEGFCGGQPLLSTLRSIQESLPPEPMGEVASALADDVGRGALLSQAMKNQSPIFSAAHISLVEGGELLGIVDRVLLLILECTWKCPTCGNLQISAETSQANRSQPRHPGGPDTGAG